MFGATKVTQFQNSRCRVQKQVLRFDVAVTNPKRMNISQTSKQLIHVQFNVTDWDSLLVFTIMTRNFVHGLRNILQHQIQINLIFLQNLQLKNPHSVPKHSDVETSFYLLNYINLPFHHWSKKRIWASLCYNVLTVS